MIPMKYLLSSFVFLLCTLSCRAAKPNVVFLFADDMRTDTIAAMGNPVCQTPNLDSLVKNGFWLKNAYCFGGNSAAVCLPSRNMLLSGNSYFRWKDVPAQGPKGPRGMMAPATETTFPAVMKSAGYLTYHHGKRGNTAQVIQAQFEVNKYLANDDVERRSGEPGKVIVDDAISFLKGKKDDRPICMYLAFGNPHDPRVAAKKYLDLYERSKLPLMKNYLPLHPFDNGELTVRDEQLSPWPRSEDEIHRTLHEYYATVTAMDSHIGRLLKYFKESGQFENTIFVFSADQGISIGSHGLLGKQNLYDHAMKAPLVFAGPGIPKGQSEALVHLFDIFPTIAELVGAKVPGKIDGQSFNNVVQGRENVARKEIMLAYRGVQRAIRDQQWKLILYPEVNITQLFDLRNDPDEMKNLAAEPDQAGRVKTLLDKLKELQTHYGDTLPLSSDKPKLSRVTAEELRLRVKK